MHCRPSLLLPVLLLAACGDPAATTGVGETEGAGTSSTGAPASETTPTTVTVGSVDTTDTPTGGTVGETEGGTTTSTSTTDEPGTTSPGEITTGTSTTGRPETSTTLAEDTTTTGEQSTGPIDETTGSSSSTGGVELCGCPDIEVPLDDGIFVLSGDGELWKYFPMTGNFELLGALECPGLFSTFSMAVDRLGFAWVQFVDGSLRKVPVTDVSQCDNPGYAVGQQGVQNFGMAFVSNSESDACDRIYGNTYNNNGPFAEGPNIGDFISIDPDDLQVSKLGKTNFNGAEVTGTGDGRAFVFGGSNPSKLVEHDKTDGSIVQVLPLGTLEINNGAFAFAFFAGDFYFFTDSDNDFTNSEVTHLDYDDSDKNGVQDLTLLTDNAPLQIVGAGVSTCAPTAPQ